MLIEGNLIKQVGPGLSADGAEVIDGGGRTLMPGLIDMHSHLAMQEGLYEGRDNWDQMAMGEMNPYKYGTLGTIAEGGYADIILVDGNPIQDLKALERDRVHFVMKGGIVYKNKLY